MDYYATYRLPDGRWQTTASFDSKKEAISCMKFHSQGRDWIVEISEEVLEKKKKEMDALRKDMP